MAITAVAFLIAVYPLMRAKRISGPAAGGAPKTQYNPHAQRFDYCLVHRPARVKQFSFFCFKRCFGGRANEYHITRRYPSRIDTDGSEHMQYTRLHPPSAR